MCMFLYKMNWLRSTSKSRDAGTVYYPEHCMEMSICSVYREIKGEQMWKRLFNYDEVGETYTGFHLYEKTWSAERDYPSLLSKLGSLASPKSWSAQEKT